MVNKTNWVHILTPTLPLPRNLNMWWHMYIANTLSGEWQEQAYWGEKGMLELAILNVHLLEMEREGGRGKAHQYLILWMLCCCFLKWLIPANQVQRKDIVILAISPGGSSFYPLILFLLSLTTQTLYSQSLSPRPPISLPLAVSTNTHMIGVPLSVDNLLLLRPE